MFAAPPQTPQRPLPGAYVQTPAPSLNVQSRLVEPVNSRSGVAISQPQYGLQGQKQTLSQPRQANGSAISRPPAEDLTPIERASRTINQTLEQEARYPALDTSVSRMQFKNKYKAFILLTLCRNLLFGL